MGRLLTLDETSGTSTLNGILAACRLLDTIAQVYKKCNNREDDAVVKLSEVVVLEMPRDRKARILTLY